MLSVSNVVKRIKRIIATTGHSGADIIPDFRHGSAQNPVISVKRLCSQSAQNPFRNLATTNMWTEMRGAARCQSPEIRALCPALIYPRTPGCFRKLNNGTPSQKCYWQGVVLFTPVLRMGVNDKIGLRRAKLRFTFRRCPVGAGHDEGRGTEPGMTGRDSHMPFGRRRRPCLREREGPIAGAKHRVWEG